MIDKKIVTTFIYPPIPIRTHDWCAYFDGEEENGNYGYGQTEQTAINDLLNNYDYDDGASKDYGIHTGSY